MHISINANRCEPSPMRKFHPFAVAAKKKDGSGAVFVVRYSEDNNVTDTATVKIVVPGVSLVNARCHLTDAVRTYTEVPLDIQPGGEGIIRMQPNSFAFIEW